MSLSLSSKENFSPRSSSNSAYKKTSTNHAQPKTKQSIKLSQQEQNNQSSSSKKKK
jgi:hypothetical protein